MATTRNLWQRLFPKFYGSTCSNAITRIVKHRFFGWAFDSLICANALFIGVGLDAVEVPFLILFNLEIALKIYASGPKDYFRNSWNRFDFLVILAATVYTIVDAAVEKGAWSLAAVGVPVVTRYVCHPLRLAACMRRV